MACSTFATTLVSTRTNFLTVFLTVRSIWSLEASHGNRVPARKDFLKFYRTVRPLWSLGTCNGDGVSTLWYGLTDHYLAWWAWLVALLWTLVPKLAQNFRTAFLASEHD